MLSVILRIFDDEIIAKFNDVLFNDARYYPRTAKDYTRTIENLSKFTAANWKKMTENNSTSSIFDCFPFLRIKIKILPFQMVYRSP